MGSAAASPRLYTSAQVAGISVGTSMGVFLLTLVVLLLLIHRRRSHAESQRRLGNGLHRLTPGATATTLEAPPQPARNRPPPQDIVDIISLPSPVFDNELGRQNSIIKTSIANHVYQFYGDRLPKKFNRTGLSTGLSENELDILLRDQRRQSLVICQFFAQQLLASISPFYEPEFALLPSRWVELLRDSPLHGPDTSHPEEFPSRSRRFWWMSLWGALSAALLEPSKIPSDDVVASVSARIAQEIEKVFPYNAPMDDFERRNASLVYLVRSTAKLGFSMIANSDACDFVWRPADEVGGPNAEDDQVLVSSHGCLIVYPTLRRRKMETDGYFGKSVVVYKAEVEKLST